MVYYILVKKIPSLTRREFLKAAGLAFPGVLSVFTLPQASQWVHRLGAPVVLYHGSRDLSQVAMTFDDCYDLALLQQWADFLEEYPKARMTFFPVGTALENAAAKRPALWKKLAAQGHELGYHSYSHSTPSTMSVPAALDDYIKWYAAAKEATGTELRVRFARPPFGELSYSFLNMCSQNNLNAAMWTNSWGMADVYYEQEKKRVQKGDIILFHIRYQDLENAKNALSFFLSRSLNPVTMSELYDSGLQPQDDVPPHCQSSPRKVCPR